jgi:hypothetical protein
MIIINQLFMTIWVQMLYWCLKSKWLTDWRAIKNWWKLRISTINFYLSNYKLHLCSKQVDLQLPMQLVLITTKIMSSNPVHGEVYSIQQYVIKFVSDLQQISVFHRVLQFPPLIKLTATIQLKYHWKWRLMPNNQSNKTSRWNTFIKYS